MFSPKMLQNCHFYYKYQIFEKKHFWTHGTVGSCSKLVREGVEKISENSTMWIARY